MSCNTTTRPYMLDTDKHSCTVCAALPLHWLQCVLSVTRSDGLEENERARTEAVFCWTPKQRRRDVLPRSDPWNGRHVLAVMVRVSRTSGRCVVALHQRSAKSTWLWLSGWAKLTCRLFRIVNRTVARTAEGCPMPLPISTA